MVETIKLDDNYDISFGQDGSLEVIRGTEAITNMLRLDLESNSGWGLDRRLGFEWINKIGTGFLQTKGREVEMVNALIKKMQDRDDVDAVSQVDVIRMLNRKYKIVFLVRLVNQETVTLEKEVSI